MQYGGKDHRPVVLSPVPPRQVGWASESFWALETIQKQLIPSNFTDVVSFSSVIWQNGTFFGVSSGV